MNLLSSRALSDEMPAEMVDGLAHRALRGLLDLAVVERLERHRALDELLLEHLAQGARAGPRSTVRNVIAWSF